MDAMYGRRGAIRRETTRVMTNTSYATDSSSVNLLQKPSGEC